MKRIMIFVLIALLALNVNAAVTGNSPSLTVIQGFDKDSSELILTNDDVNESADCVFTMTDFYATDMDNISFTLNETSPFEISNSTDGGNQYIMIDVAPVAEDQGVATYKADYTFNCSYNATDYSEGTGQATLVVKARSESISLSPSSQLLFTGDINTSRTLTFTITNNGNVNLTNLEATDNIASEYNAILTSNTISILEPGENYEVTAKINIPNNQDSGLKNLGTLTVASDQETFTKTNYFKINAAGLLEITDLDVDVDNPGESSKSSNGLDDGETIGRDAEPGATVEFQLELTNNHENDEDDWEIQDIEVTVTIKDIDDEGDDDLEEEATFKDLEPGDDDKVTLRFDIPWEVEDQDYDVEIHVEGEDEETGDTVEVDWTLTLQVNKEKTKLKLTKANLDSDTLKCFRSTSLEVEALNIGEKDEDDSRLIVYSEELGISFTKNFELTNDVYDDDSKQSFNIPIDLTDSFKAGSYRIDIQLFSDVDEEEDDFQLSLRVEDCETTKPTEPTTPTTPTTPDTDDDDTMDVEYTDGQTTSSGGAVAAPVTSVATKDNDALYVALLVLGIIVCVLLVIWLVMQLFKK